MSFFLQLFGRRADRRFRDSVRMGGIKLRTRADIIALLYRAALFLNAHCSSVSVFVSQQTDLSAPSGESRACLGSVVTIAIIMESIRENPYFLPERREPLWPAEEIAPVKKGRRRGLIEVEFQDVGDWGQAPGTFLKRSPLHGIEWVNFEGFAR
jgi:hypothetical protein